MRLVIISLFLIIGNPTITVGQVHIDWKQKDIVLLDSLLKIVNDDPAKVQEYFSRHSHTRQKDAMGFGWTKLDQVIGAGYISVWAEFYFFKDSLQSYNIKTRSPSEVQLLGEYIEMYLRLPMKMLNNGFCYEYKIENIRRPIEEFTKTKLASTIPTTLLNYMSPESDIVYGNRGGMAMSVLRNREMFNAIKNKLTNDQVITLMYSINPASRLTAIEFYLRNKKRFPRSEKIQKWIESIYREVPEVNTMSGCLFGKESSKSLVINYVKTTPK